MSQANVELALGAVDAVARMDLTRLIELTDPAVEWHSFLAQLGEGGVYRGHDGMREYVRDAWDVFSAEIQDTLAVGEIVVMVGRLRYRGKGSGVDTQSPAGHVVRFSPEKDCSHAVGPGPRGGPRSRRAGRVVVTFGLSV